MARIRLQAAECPGDRCQRSVRRDGPNREKDAASFALIHSDSDRNARLGCQGWNECLDRSKS